MREKSKAGGITLPDFKLYYKAIVIKTIWYYWHKNRHIDQWNRTEAINKPTHIWSINLWQRSQENTRAVCSITVAGENGQPHAKEWNYTCFLHHIQSNSKWITDFNIKPVIIKLLEENIGCNQCYLDIGFDDDFFGLDTKSKGNKIKNKQVTLLQTKKLLHSIGNHL